MGRRIDIRLDDPAEKLIAEAEKVIGPIPKGKASGHYRDWFCLGIKTDLAERAARRPRCRKAPK
jgi:hypothetical protein